MIKCPFCHTMNEDGALFCETCKSDLTGVPSEGVAMAPPPVPVMAEAMPVMAEAKAPAIVAYPAPSTPSGGNPRRPGISRISSTAVTTIPTALM